VEDARRVWIYSAMPDCLADGHVMRRAVWAAEAMVALGLGEPGDDSKGAIRGVLLVLLYSWHADDASEVKPGSGRGGRSIKRIRARSGEAATLLTV
jgi:hypothetical protein